MLRSCRPACRSSAPFARTLRRRARCRSRARPSRCWSAPNRAAVPTRPARLIAPYLRKYLPGGPNVVVQNMPGAERHHGAQLLRPSHPARRPHRRQWVDLDGRSDEFPALDRPIRSQDLPLRGRHRARRQHHFRQQGCRAASLRQVARPVVIGSILAVPRSVHAAGAVVHRISRLEREMDRRLSRDQRGDAGARSRRDRHDLDRKPVPDQGPPQQRAAQDRQPDRRA